MTLSADPERTVTIPVTATAGGGATAQDEPGTDYSGVPLSVTFNEGDTEKTFTITAAQDTVDDDGESIALAFGNMPDGVTRGTGATVNIDDDDHPQVTVIFKSATYTAAEGATATVVVKLSADPERDVSIPITVTNLGTTETADYSGIPVVSGVTVKRGETEGQFTFRATQDSVDDDDESVQLGFKMADLPERITVGATPTGIQVCRPRVPKFSVAIASRPRDG